MNPSESIVLLGGNVSLDGAVIKAPGGRVELGSLAVPGTVGLKVNGSTSSPTGTNLVLTFPLGVPRADISLSNNTDVFVRADGGGSIAVNSHNLNMTGESLIRAGIAPNSGHVGSQGRDIDINATGTITLREGSNIDNSVTFGAVGNAGNVIINASNSINMDRYSFDGNLSSVNSTVALGANGNGGNISITSKSLNLTNGGTINVFTVGNGNAGSVLISATNSINIDGVSSDFGYSSGVFSQPYDGSKGNGGNINITSPFLSITNGGVLSTVTLNSYKGANIIGNVNTLELKSGGEILTTAYNSGSAGNVNLNVKNGITISGSDPTFTVKFAKFGRDTSNY